jgi:membrane protein YdbS with pleckstrin-like domain
VIQPLSRIQHIELKRGPLERSAGLATSHVYSAGGGAHTFEIPGLPVEQAQGLRQFILQHQDLQHGG